MAELFQYAINHVPNELRNALFAFVVSFVSMSVAAYCLIRYRRRQPSFVLCRRSMAIAAVEAGESGVRLKTRGVA